MIKTHHVDFGAVRVDNRVLAQITRAAIEEIGGVSLVPANFADHLVELWGVKTTPGISVTVDKNNSVVIDVKVCVRYGMHLPDIAHHVQDVVREAIEKMTDIDLKDVNVSIQGIERGES